MAKRQSSRRPAKRRRSRAGRVRPPSRRLFRRMVGYTAEAGVFAMTGAIALAAGVAWFARDLPDTDSLWRAERSVRVAMFAADGAPMVVRGEAAGAPVRLASLPPHVPNAVIAIEDRNFRHHIGVNPLSVARAFLVNAVEGEIRQGGSTITQQLAKNVFLSPERTIKRKIQEVLLAFWLERRFTKDEILTLYLNRVYFGAGAYGIDAASRRYFGKPAERLSVAEAAVLAGLLKAPSRYAPTVDPLASGRRARLVLDAMVKNGLLTPEIARAEGGAPVRLAVGDRVSAPYFVDAVEARMREVAGNVDADLVARTTLDAAVQAGAEAALARGVAASGLPREVEVAVVVMDGSGAVVAMIGGRDYRRSQFNRTTQARRQPGSAFKPFVFLAAMEAGHDPRSRILDAPVTVGAWSPGNYKDKFYGDVSLTEAMALSLNSAAVRLQERTGRNAVRLAARRMGFDARLTAGPSLALGVDETTPLALAAAYAPFANGGYRVRPHLIASVATADGDPVFHAGAVLDGRAASAEAIASMNHMLRAVTLWGTGKAAQIEGASVHGKTGTSQDNRDAWFAGHAGGLVCVVWVGRDDNGPVRDRKGDDVTGGAAPAIIWREVMTAALSARGLAVSGAAPTAAPGKSTGPRAPPGRDTLEPAILAPLQPAPVHGPGPSSASPASAPSASTPQAVVSPGAP